MQHGAARPGDAQRRAAVGDEDERRAAGGPLLRRLVEVAPDRGPSQSRSSALTLTTSARATSRSSRERTTSAVLPSAAPTGPSASIGRMLGSTLISAVAVHAAPRAGRSRRSRAPSSWRSTRRAGSPSASGRTRGQLLVRPLPVGGALARGSRSRRAVRAEPDDGQADRLGRRTNPADVDAGELGVPAQVGAQRAGAQPGQQVDRRAQPAGRDRDVEGVAAGPGDVLRRRPLGPRVRVRHGQHVDDQLAEDAEHRVAAGHGANISARVNRSPRWLPERITWDDGDDEHHRAGSCAGAGGPMPNPFVKLWKYLTASANAQIDQRADPKIQIAQAIEAEQQRHQALANQAAAVLGNQRQLEMRLNRQLGEVEKLQASARQALVLADKTRAGGDATKAAEYENAAQAFATQLVAAEQSMEDLKRSHDEALQAAEQARGAVEQSRMRLQTTLAERTKLMSQLEQAKMQEHVAASLRQVNELSAPGNTPSLSEVRDKIEARYANALGQAELAQTSVEGRMLEVQKATLDVAGASRLDQIRASMGGGPAGVEGSQPAAAIEQGAPPVQRRPPSSARHSRPSGPTSRPDRAPGHDRVRPGYPPAELHRLGGGGHRVGARGRHPARAADGRGRRGALPGHRRRRPAALSGSTGGTWAPGRRARRRTSTAASPSRSTC